MSEVTSECSRRGSREIGVLPKRRGPYRRVYTARNRRSRAIWLRHLLEHGIDGRSLLGEIEKDARRLRDDAGARRDFLARWKTEAYWFHSFLWNVAKAVIRGQNAKDAAERQFAWVFGGSRACVPTLEADPAIRDLIRVELHGIRPCTIADETRRDEAGVRRALQRARLDLWFESRPVGRPGKSRIAHPGETSWKCDRSHGRSAVKCDEYRNVGRP